ncbi:MAG: T9SS type A sorting domain-containing protein [Cytophagaceae bacterium]|jgi:hypothetical protein|nr:T9SS type A sorting domain-containing protein [Cytophagaceae bacterium]
MKKVLLWSALLFIAIVNEAKAQLVAMSVQQTSVCIQETAEIRFYVSGQEPYRVTYQINNVTQVVVFNNSQLNVNYFPVFITPTSYTTVRLVSMVDGTGRTASRVPQFPNIQYINVGTPNLSIFSYQNGFSCSDQTVVFQLRQNSCSNVFWETSSDNGVTYTRSTSGFTLTNMSQTFTNSTTSLMQYKIRAGVSINGQNTYSPVFNHTVFPTLVPGTITSLTSSPICTGFPVTLTATKPIAASTIVWQVNTGYGWVDEPSNGETYTFSSRYSSNVPQVYKYRAAYEYSNQTCATRVYSNEINVTFTPPTPTPQIFIYNPIQVCSGSTFQIPDLLPATFIANVQWQISEDGRSFSDIEGKTQFGLTHSILLSSNQSKTYFVRAKVSKEGSCAIHYTNNIMVQVAPVPSLGDITTPNIQVCETALVPLSVSSYSGAKLSWNKVESSGSFYEVASNTTNYTTQRQYVSQPQSNITYRLIASSPGCSTVSKDITLEVYKTLLNISPTQEMYSNPPNICSGGSATLSVVAPPYGSIQWTEKTGTNVFTDIPNANQPVWVTPPQEITGNNPILKTYYAYGVNGPCALPISGTPITFTVYPSVQAGDFSVASTQYCYTSPAQIQLINASGTTYEWFLSKDNVTFTRQWPAQPTRMTMPYENLNPTETTRTYYVKAQVSNPGCSAVSTRIVEMTSHNKTLFINSNYPTTINACGSTANQEIRVTNSSWIGNLQWMFSTSAAGPYQNVTNGLNVANAPLPLWSNTSLTTQTYYVKGVLENNVCGSIQTPLYTLNVHPNPTASSLSTSESDFCIGKQTQFLLPGARYFSVYNSLNQLIASGTNGVANFNPNQWFTTNSQNITYYAVINSEYCPPIRTNNITVTTYKPTASSGTVLRLNTTCSLVPEGQTVSLSLSSTPVATRYIWKVRIPGSTVFTTYKTTTTPQLISDPLVYQPGTNSEYVFQLAIANGPCTEYTYPTTFTVKVIPGPTNIPLIVPSFICATSPTFSIQVKDEGQTIVRLSNSSGTVLNVLPVKANGYFSFTLTATTNVNYTVLNTFTNSFCSQVTTQLVAIPYNASLPASGIIEGPASACADFPPLTYTIRPLQSDETIAWNFSPNVGTFSRPTALGITIFSMSGYTGIFTIQATITNGCGLQTTMTKQIDIRPLPAVEFVSIPTEVCLNAASIPIVTTKAGGTFTTTAQLTSSGVFTPNQVGLSGIRYVYTQPSTGCSKTIEAGIQVRPIPTVNAGSDRTFCAGTSTVLSATGANQYVWSNGVQQDVPFLPPATATYSVVGVNEFNCTAQDEVLITVLPLPVIDMSPIASEYCQGSDPVLLNAHPTGGSYSGNFVQGNRLTTTIGAPTSVTYSYIDPITGCSSTLTKAINIFPKPSIPLICSVEQGWCTPAEVDVCFFTEDRRTSGYEWYQINPRTFQFDLIPSHTARRSPFTSSSTTYYLKPKAANGCTGDVFPLYIHIGKPTIAPIELNAPGSIILTNYLDGPLNATNVTFVEGFKGAVINPYLPYTVNASKTILAFSTFSKIDGTVCFSEATTVPITVGNNFQARTATIPSEQVSFSLFPNPTTGSITLVGLQEGMIYDVHVMSSTGEQVWTKQVLATSTDLTLPTESLPIGVYFLHIQTGDTIKTLKFIRQE